MLDLFFYKYILNFTGSPRFARDDDFFLMSLRGKRSFPWQSKRNERSELKHSAGAVFFSFSWGTRSFSLLSERKEKEWVQKNLYL